MKTLALCSTLLLSSLAYADIDYSRCNHLALAFTNASIDNDGKLTALYGTQITDIKTVGREETYKLKRQIAAMDSSVATIETEITLTRDKFGRVIKIKTGGDKPSQSMIDMYQSAPYGSGAYYPGNSFNSQQPLLKIGDESLPLDQVSDEQAQSAGIKKPLDDFRRLNSQNRKDKPTLKKIHESYSKIRDLVDHQIPFGMESELEVKDGACMLKSTSHRVYSTKSKEVTAQLASSRESCEEIKKLHKKYEPKLNECQSVTQNLNREYWDNFGSKFSQYPYSTIGGMGFGFGGGGLVGGSYGGVVGGTYGGYGGYTGYGMHIAGPIQAQLWSCEYYYGVQPIPEFGGMGGWGEAPAAKAKEE